jgi:hypothetical protein
METELLSKQHQFRIARMLKAGSVTNQRQTGILNLSKQGPAFEPIADPRGDWPQVSFREQNKVGVGGINKSIFERVRLSEEVCLPAFDDPPNPNITTGADAS